MSAVLQRILSTSAVRRADGTEAPVHSHISETEGEFIQSLVRSHKPRVSLEVGCAFGISSLYICEALKSIDAERHIVIDPRQNDVDQWQGIGLLNLQRAGFSDLVEFHAEPSYECLPKLLARGQRIDFAFIDGVHNFDYVLVDFFMIDKMLNVGGVVVFDDYSWPSVRKACRFIAANLPYHCIGPTGHKARLKNRLASAVAQLPLLSRWSRSELSLPDQVLGLPPGSASFVAMQKHAEDRLGTGAECTRGWASHKAF
jgi:predicted O-methyltransferase YrrM